MQHVEDGVGLVAVSYKVGNLFICFFPCNLAVVISGVQAVGLIDSKNEVLIVNNGRKEILTDSQLGVGQTTGPFLFDVRKQE